MRRLTRLQTLKQPRDPTRNEIVTFPPVRDSWSRSWWVESLASGKEADSIVCKQDWLRLGGLLMTSRSGGLKLRAVAGKPSVTKLTLSIFDAKTSRNLMQLLSYESYTNCNGANRNLASYIPRIWQLWTVVQRQESQSSCTGAKPSGIPRAAVKKMDATSPQHTAIIGYHRHKCYHFGISICICWTPRPFGHHTNVRGNEISDERLIRQTTAPLRSHYRQSGLPYLSISFHGLQAQVV